MTHRPSPVSVSDLPGWRRETGANLSEARRRFVVYVVLQALGHGTLRNRVVAKGGNALRYFYGSVRSTLDVDLSVVGDWSDDKEEVRTAFEEPLRSTASRHGIELWVQGIRRQPAPGPNRTWPTYNMSVAFQFPGDRWFGRSAGRHDVSDVVRVGVSLNEEVCGRTTFDLGGVRVVSSSLEDIVAEKLRALLQQRGRPRCRPQDVYDISNLLRTRGAALDRAAIGEFLVRKAKARRIEPKRSSFDEEVRTKAQEQYYEVERTTGTFFIPFDEAWTDVLRLVGELPIPE